MGGRSNIIRLPERVVIDDCYNANPVSMCAALDLLEAALTRRVAVMGDMFELGDNKERMHAKVGAYAVEKGIEVIVCIGELSINMYDSAGEAMQEAGRENTELYYFPGKKEFLEKMSGILRKGDTVLVKASHGMAFEEIVKALYTSSLFLK